MDKPKQVLHRALVTGATGYVGSNLTKRLVFEGWDVHIVVQPNSGLTALESISKQITIHQHNGTTADMIRLVGKANPEIVFHLASKFLVQHRPEDIAALISSNLLFSTQLVEALAVNKVTYLVNTSTSWQHYESAEYDPVNLYAATKQAFEDILVYYTNACDIKVTTLTLFDTYGPNDFRQKLFSILRCAYLSNQMLNMSPGHQLIDIVHIEDVVRAFLIVSDRFIKGLGGNNERFSVTSGSSVTLKDLVESFIAISGVSLAINWGGRPYRFREVMIPLTKSDPVPGWSPQIALEDGLRQMAAEMTESTRE